MNKKDWRDYLTGGVLAALSITLIIVMFKNWTSVAMIGTCGGIIGTLCCALRWFDLKDDKTKDAQ